MAFRFSLPLLGVFLLFSASAFSADKTHDTALRQAVDDNVRTPAFVARDKFRKPYEVLRFFGVRPDATVVEISPGGGGYWTEILAPYLKESGVYYAAQYPASGSNRDYHATYYKNFRAKLDADPKRYGNVKVTVFAKDHYDIAPPGSADFVVTFRNLHNWMRDGFAEEAIAAFYKALKPGGILGIEAHRGRTDKPQDSQAADGYVRQDYAIKMIEKAGFVFEESSEILANAKDTKDYSAGVWTLPPTYRLGDQDRDRYAAIGEADGFLLKFRKP